MNWPQYHRSKASFFRDTAAEYRRTFNLLFPTDPHLAGFALERAAQNETWAVEEDQAAQAAMNGGGR